jgi:hypothetical protein
MVLDPETIELLEAGSALIIGTVTPDGVPHACRGWGLEVDTAQPGRVRILIDSEATQALANLEQGRPVAVTAADVRTLRSVQLKGASAGIQAAGPDDLERMARYTAAFYDDIVATDGTPLTVLRRLTPDEVVAVQIDVTDQFDQTPGPDAGRAVAPAEQTS